MEQNDYSNMVPYDYSGIREYIPSYKGIKKPVERDGKIRKYLISKVDSGYKPTNEPDIIVSDIEEFRKVMIEKYEDIITFEYKEIWVKKD